MKYLFAILALVVVSSALTLYSLWPTDPTPPSRELWQKSSHSGDPDDHQLIDYSRATALLTRQTLVREAQRLGIDKEESFRRSLKEYYEQSLVKVLTDRKLAEVEVAVSEEDIDRYLASSGKTFVFTRFQVENGKIREQKGHQKTVLFDDLSASLRSLIADLQPGESAKRFATGTELCLIRLDKIEATKEIEVIQYDRDRVREQLENYQRSLAIDRWINELRKNQ